MHAQLTLLGSGAGRDEAEVTVVSNGPSLLSVIYPELCSTKKKPHVVEALSFQIATNVAQEGVL